MARVTFIKVLFLAMFFAKTAHADCYADYKAKQDDPLRLHYGVMTVEASPCASSPNINADVSRRLEAAGWTLLQVESVFDKAALDKKKEADTKASDAKRLFVTSNEVFAKAKEDAELVVQRASAADRAFGQARELLNSLKE